MKKSLPPEEVAKLRAKLEELAPREEGRKQLIESFCNLYDVSRATVYRAIRGNGKLKVRADKGRPRKISRSELEKYCQIIAALKLRTENKKGRHISTKRSIELLEKYGVETPSGLVKAPMGLLSRSLVNRYLNELGYDRVSMSIQPPSVRFQAAKSNQCWQLDLSPSDLKHIPEPSWIDPEKGKPTLYLFSVTDDRSGANYTEYRCVYGEEVEATLRFLFNAMTAKNYEGFLFQGIPEMIYMDNGPVAKSKVFGRVLDSLGIKLHTHLPKDKDGRRKTARSKGKVERPFRTFKEGHETLYHFHTPRTEKEANEWMAHYLMSYNQQGHRSEPHSRIADWLSNLPEEGYREMCSWERFCTFAREPERAKVSGDSRISVDGIYYEVDPELVGEKVFLWWGLLDNELFVEVEGKRYGPYSPVGAPIQINKYRKFKKTKREKRADSIELLAKQINLPREALTSKVAPLPNLPTSPAKSIPFPDSITPEALEFENHIEAKLAISKYLGLSIGSLPKEQRDFVAALVASSLNKAEVLSEVKSYFRKVKRKRKES